MTERSNIDAIYREYPFLGKLVPRAEVNAVHVKRLNAKDLAKVAPTDIGSGSYSDVYFFIWFLDHEGNILDQVGSVYESNGSLYVNHNETIGQAIARIGNQSTRVGWLLNATPWIRKRFLRFPIIIPWDNLILYKLPKGCSNAQQWVASVAEEGRAALREI